MQCITHAYGKDDIDMKPYYYEKGKEGISGSAPEVVRKIVDNYCKLNPKQSFEYRAFHQDELKRQIGDERFLMDFDERFPEAEDGDYAYAFAKFYSDSARKVTFSITVHNESELFINGVKVTQTIIYDEVINEFRTIEVFVEKGENTVFIKCRKNILGFRYIFGNHMHRVSQIHFYKAFKENEGELGWNYCGPFKEDIFTTIPKAGDSMEAFWLPKPYVNTLPKNISREKVYAISTLVCERDGEVQFSVKAAAKAEIYINGELCKVVCSEHLADCKEQMYTINAALRKGTHALSVQLTNLSSDCTLITEINGAELALPECVKDIRGNWLYLNSPDENAKQGFKEYFLYDSYVQGEKEFFQCGENTYIRPVFLGGQFGRCTYPLGVSLYGILTAGNYLGDKDVLRYVHEHLETVFGSMKYALWDSEKFGMACINHILTNIISLNDCGSFCAAILEDYLKYQKDDRVLDFADYVADYILHKQERLANGMFYRENLGALSKQIIWADDLYMSIPFMVRYATLTGDSTILDDAVNQFLCFKEKLFMEERSLMAHVYSLPVEKNTQVPWGRGNGWVLFSLTELLQVLPKEHKKYEEMKAFFQRLAKGFLEHMDEDGMIHQIIDAPDSYPEASGTAMCAASLARGVRMGLLPAEEYQEPANRAVEGLKKLCVDEEGSVYGVCRGSGYSFRLNYYKHELNWVLNDTHGIGMVLIAIVETEGMNDERESH